MNFKCCILDVAQTSLSYSQIKKLSENKTEAMKKIEKLVRDNIPQIIIGSGNHCDFRILNDDEYTFYLRKKLEEEVCEFIEDDSIEELADLLEVIEAIALFKGTSWEELICVKKEKAMKKGAFAKKLFLIKADIQ